MIYNNRKFKIPSIQSRTKMELNNWAPSWAWWAWVMLFLLQNQEVRDNFLNWMSEHGEQYPLYLGITEKKVRLCLWVYVRGNDRTHRSILRQLCTKVHSCKISVKFVNGQNFCNPYCFEKFIHPNKRAFNQSWSLKPSYIFLKVKITIKYF